MRKRRIAGLFSAVCLLLAFLLFRGWLEQKQMVTWDDVVFSLDTGKTQAKIRLWHNYYDNKEYLFLPAFCGEETTAHIEAGNGIRQSWDGKGLWQWESLEQLSTGEHTLKLGGSEFTVVILHSGNVPALFLTTESGSLSYIEAEKGNAEPGLYRMVDADGIQTAEGQMKKLKSRGNATFLEDKKPYQMTLEEPVDLLGGGLQDKYILLANRQDQSLLRDKIMYDLSADMGLAYSPKSCFVDLYVNNDYRGCYQLSEKVETGHGRIAVDTDTRQEETGFLVTLEYAVADRLTEADCYFVTENGQHVVVKRPNMPDADQLAYIESCFQAVEDDIRSKRLPSERIDTISFARKYLVEEIGKNLDAMYTSQYFYQQAGEDKLYAGPVWDYDKTLGNPLIEHNRPVDFQEPRGIFAATKQENASWWYDLYQIPAFREAVAEEFADSALPAIDGMLEGKIDSYHDEIRESAAMDYMRWDPFEDFKYGEPLEFETEYQAEVDHIKEFLRLRRQFLCDIWLEGRAYGQVTLDAGEGTIYVTKLDAVEGRTLNEPRDPKLEGFAFSGWVREDTGEFYDFDQVYDGEPFTLQAVYVKEEQDEE